MLIAALAALAVSTGPAMTPVPFEAPAAPYEASLAYMLDGAPHVERCTAPCVLSVPTDAPFAVAAAREGVRVQLKPMAWGYEIGGQGKRLYPATVRPKGE